MNPSLHSFVAAARSAGASDEFLAALLIRRGWPAEDVYNALGEYWAARTGVPVPVRKGAAESARDAFLYLLAFCTLATWATAFGSLLFGLVDRWLPDPVSPAFPLNARSQLTWQIASVMVAFPIYLIVQRMIVWETTGDPERLKSGVRRWLTWLALLITAGTMIGDLIFFLNSFLTGGLTLRFVLKSAVVFAIAGAIFLYYLNSLRWDGTGDAGRESSRQLRFGQMTSAVVVLGCIAGFAVAGSPTSQRRVEADSRRVSDLLQISRGIGMWRYRHPGALPASLNDPGLTAYINQNRTDPQTGAAYGYRPLDAQRYELCANFAGPNEPGSDAFWNHAAGLTCFTISAGSTP